MTWNVINNYRGNLEIQEWGNIQTK